MKKFKPDTVKKLGYVWGYMILFGCFILFMLGFSRCDYFDIFGGLFLLNFAMNVLILTDLYSHCHNIKVWNDDVIKEDENE